MEIWRIIGTSITGLGGLLIVALVMAKVRDRRNSTSGKVVRAGLIAFFVLAVVVLASATVLPQPAVWAIAAVVGFVALTLVLVDA